MTCWMENVCCRNPSLFNVVLQLYFVGFRTFLHLPSFLFADVTICASSKLNCAQDHRFDLPSFSSHVCGLDSAIQVFACLRQTFCRSAVWRFLFASSLPSLLRTSVLLSKSPSGPVGTDVDHVTSYFSHAPFGLGFVLTVDKKISARSLSKSISSFRNGCQDISSYTTHKNHLDCQASGSRLVRSCTKNCTTRVAQILASANNSPISSLAQDPPVSCRTPVNDNATHSAAGC